MDNAEELSRLEAIASDSWYARGVNTETIRYSGEIFARHWSGTSCLELGPAEGVMTQRLAATFPKMTLVDGSDRFCRSLREQFPQAEVVHSLFEHFEPVQRFDAIILGHVLEHVDDPVRILKSAGDWLTPAGRIFAAVPNARSIHRQAAVVMGLLRDEFALNESDIHHGHRRVYDPERFRADFRAAELNIIVFGGYWLKPLSNAQLDDQWSPEMIRAFMAVGERYPDIAAEIYVVASN